MPAQVIDGKAIAARVRAEVREEVDRLRERGVVPGLHVVLVGDDPASHVYVRNKGRACEEVGIAGVTHRLPAETPEADVLALVRELNASAAVDGILVQLPVPRHIDPQKVTHAVDPQKDVDGYHPASLGALVAGLPGLVSCTPAGCLRLIDETGTDLAGKRAVVVGRSVQVGKPMALLLMARNATVTVCHSRTVDLAGRVREAEVLVAAIGRAELVKGDWIRPGAVVIDVGINRAADGKLVGDVEYAAAAERAAWITPVPGGVGPMTIAYLLKNTIAACKARRGL